MIHPARAVWGHRGAGVRHLPCNRSRPMWAAAGGGFIGSLRRRRRQLRRKHRALPVQARGEGVEQRAARKIQHSSFNRLHAARDMRHATPRKRCRPARALQRLRTDLAMRVVRQCAVRLRDASMIYHATVHRRPLPRCSRGKTHGIASTPAHLAAACAAPNARYAARSSEDSYGWCGCVASGWVGG